MTRHRTATPWQPRWTLLAVPTLLLSAAALSLGSVTASAEEVTIVGAPDTTATPPPFGVPMPGANIECNGLTEADALLLNYDIHRGTSASEALGDSDATADWVLGLGGDDTVVTGSDSDIICGGTGDDTITSNDGLDHVFGEGGDDTVNLGPGVYDFGFGGPGEDQIDGGAGPDTIYGDDLPGGPVAPVPGASDTLEGGPGDDELRGGDLVDLISGGSGDDALYGDGGNDDLRGGTDADDLTGGSGNDVGYGGPGTDTLCDTEALFTCP